MGLFGDLFDFNNDGKLDAFEKPSSSFIRTKTSQGLSATATAPALASTSLRLCCSFATSLQ